MQSHWTNPVPQALQRHTGCQLVALMRREGAPPLVPQGGSEREGQPPVNPEPCGRREVPSDHRD